VDVTRITQWLLAGYLDPNTADRTGFQIHEENFTIRCLPFGLCEAPQMFKALMLKVLTGLAASTLLVHLDDNLLMGKDPLDMFRLRIHPAKCH
jgi:hypothetical protein